MPSEPTPPDSLPKYLYEGLEKQDVETLEDVISYAEELIEYRTQPPEEVESGRRRGNRREGKEERLYEGREEGPMRQGM